MLRNILLIALFSLVACGGEDADRGAAIGAAGEAAGEAAGGAEADAPSVSAVSSPEAARCLDLVGEAQFARAVPVCIEALKAQPGNRQVQAALERAQAEVPNVEDAGAAAREAAGGAMSGIGESAGESAEEATPSLGEAAGGLPGQLDD